MRMGLKFSITRNFFSTVLMAVPDANYCSMSEEVGAYGSSSDSSVMKTRHLKNFWRAIN